MSHNYHPQCGCASCDRTEEADERRDEYIADFSAPIATALIGSQDFAWAALVDATPDAKNAILQDVGQFFTAMHNARATDVGTFSAAAIRLWKELLPYVEAAAKEQAEAETAAVYDQADAA